MNKDKQFLVIGCGRFGSTVSRTLSKAGFEVLIVDKDEEKIDAIAEEVAHAVVADVSVEGTLNDLGASNFDVAIIGMSSSFQASVMATMACKDLGIPYVVVKAKELIHGRILKKLGANKIVIPERDIGIRLANTFSGSRTMDLIELSEEYSIVEIHVPQKWVGKDLKTLNIRSKYGLSIIAINRGEKIEVNPNADTILNEDEEIVIIGEMEKIIELSRMV